MSLECEYLVLAKSFSQLTYFSWSHHIFKFAFLDPKTLLLDMFANIIFSRVWGQIFRSSEIAQFLTIGNLSVKCQLIELGTDCPRTKFGSNSKDLIFLVGDMSVKSQLAEHTFDPHRIMFGSESIELFCSAFLYVRLSVSSRLTDTFWWINNDLRLKNIWLMGYDHWVRLTEPQMSVYRQ